MVTQMDAVESAECAFVGAALLDPAEAKHFVERLSADYFVNPIRGEIFNAIKRIVTSDRNLDLAILQMDVAEHFPTNPTFVGLCVTAAEKAVAEVPTAAHMGDYVRIIEGAHRRYKLGRALDAVRERLKAGADINGEGVALVAALEGMKGAPAVAHPVPEPAPAVFAKTTDAVEWILDPILAAGSILQLQGAPKAGKSCFGLVVALACAMGRWLFDRFEFHGPPRRTLYLAYEDATRRLKRRALSYLPAFGAVEVPENLLLFDRPPVLDLSTPEGAERLEAIVRDNKVEVLFIDTLSWISRGDENAKSDMMPVLSVLRKLCAEYNLAICLLHHVRKGGTGGDVGAVAERGRGSSAIAAAADGILDWGSRPSPNVTACALISKDVDGDEFHVRYSPQEDGSVLWRIEDPVEREDTVKVQGRILEAIKALSATAGDKVTASLIQGALGDLTKSSIHDHLKALIGKGKVEQLKEIGPKGARYFKLKSVGKQSPDAADGGGA